MASPYQITGSYGYCMNNVSSLGPCWHFEVIKLINIYVVA